MPKPIPDGYHSVTAVLMFKDTKRAIEFYKEAFQARQEFLMEWPKGQGVAHAQIRIGDSPVMMGDEWGDYQSAETIAGKLPVSFYLYVPNVDQSFNQAVKAGATTIRPVSDMFWGDRVGTVQDPFGYNWSFATHIKDVSDQEMAKAAEAAFAQTANKT